VKISWQPVTRKGSEVWYKVEVNLLRLLAGKGLLDNGWVGDNPISILRNIGNYRWEFDSAGVKWRKM